MLKNNSQWLNPIVNAILNHYDYTHSIFEVLEIKVNELLDIHSMTDKMEAVPIEKIANSFGVKIKIDNYESDFYGQIGKSKNSGYDININTVAYFHYRYVLAHELGHFFLRKLSGPIPLSSIPSSESSHEEEEFLCDYFAAALLVPKVYILREINLIEDVSSTIISKFSKHLKVSRKIIINRITQIKKYLALYWDEIKNPLQKGSTTKLRINDIFPNKYFLAYYYIPKYCTAVSSRFKPNLIEVAYQSGRSNKGIVTISKLGNLPSQEYSVVNIFISYWEKSFFKKGLVKNRSSFFALVTLIDLSKPNKPLNTDSVFQSGI